MTEFKVESEVAEIEFDRFIGAMDLRLDRDGLDANDKKDNAASREVMIHALKRGSLVINETGEPVFTPTRTEDAKPITFSEPTGNTLAAMDKQKTTADVSKTYAAMAQMSHTNRVTFNNMAMPDLQVCMAIFTVFLA